MENQHRQIKGYRELTQEEINVMNKIKEAGIEVGNIVNLLEHSEHLGVDQRWLSIGRTQLQQGFMALTRAVAKPDFF